MQSVGFEPTSVATIDLESTALDRSATIAIKIKQNILSKDTITQEIVSK